MTEKTTAASPPESRNMDRLNAILYQTFFPVMSRQEMLLREINTIDTDGGKRAITAVLAAKPTETRMDWPRNTAALNCTAWAASPKASQNPTSLQATEDGGKR